MFKSILVATDGSKLARKATEMASDLAVKYGAQLTIVTVTPRSLTADEVQAMPQSRRLPKAVKDEMANLRKVMMETVVDDEMAFTFVPAPQSALTALSKAILDEAEGVAKRKKVKKIARIPLAGDAAENIIAQAKKSRANLIVMGTRGLSDLGGLVMGSVSHKVIHMATCPCLTVR